MDVITFDTIPKEIKFGLVFFCLILLLGCGDSVTIKQVDYENEKAVGVRFSTPMNVEKIRVFVGEESQTSVMGVIVGSRDQYNFAPVVPFTPGQTYTFRKKNTEVLASFSILERLKTDRASLLDIYPKTDTVPENLLKMYVEFAQPMQEVGNALDFIRVTDETTGKVVHPFLRLESELWNKERTVLTLWLDPGRIKTDLIPNREMGLPLNAGKTYMMQIDSSWRSTSGMPLAKKYSKHFYVGPRDGKQPNVKSWQLRLPKAGTTAALRLDFGEPMDAFLAKETMRIHDAREIEIKGSFSLTNQETTLLFTPVTSWKKGRYQLIIQSRLEDLSGNNLNRLFETKAWPADGESESNAAKKISFIIR